MVGILKGIFNRILRIKSENELSFWTNRFEFQTNLLSEKVW